ncbi:MAG: hypothetical protein H6R18_1736 [Proteobacteria bacterium]|nr:hypothetical protein [Pseudomonadota bacterium]
MKKVVYSLIFGLLILGGIAYFLYGFATAENRVKSVCVQIKPGMSISELNAFGIKHGLNPPTGKGSGITFMVEAKTYGRYGCKVLLESGSVKNAEYSFVD